MKCEKVAAESVVSRNDFAALPIDDPGDFAAVLRVNEDAIGP